MKKVDKNGITILNTIGHTPLIKIGSIYAKLETTNPSGSIKDRMVWYIVKKAEKRGELKTGTKIVEATTGNTGISLAMISAIKGYKFTAVMPASMSVERYKIMKAFGAKIILTPAKEDVAGAVKKCKELAKKDNKIWLSNQFDNLENIASHKEGIGKEIIKDMKGNIDAFVAGAGTGGTIIGVAQALKEKCPQAKIIVIEPTESMVLSGGAPGLHRIQGIGEGFIPKILKDNIYLIDEVIKVKSRDALNMSKKIVKKYGILVGTSSGANIWAALRVNKRYKRVVTILPDRGERYLDEYLA